ncbi:MAG: hypothetical protein FWE14_02875 [Lachnospiraceae bacterium]|nr:hypothetical protein [Lachnospiraceae bacterium]
MATLEKAIQIATQAHEGKLDKGGEPFIEHPIYVMNQMPADSELLKIIAILHDTIEDNPDTYSFESLLKEGFSKDVIEPLKHLTRNKSENYWDYIRKVADNHNAIEVKLADLQHNSDESRIVNPTPKDRARCNRYLKAIKYLNTVKEFKANNSGLDLVNEPFKYILTRLLFENISDDYAAFCRTLILILEAASKSVCPSAIIQGRVKKPDSFTEKCARKAKKYGNTVFELMTDLCGNRVVLQTTGQVADYCEFIKKYFDVDWANSEDTGARLGDAEFGYISQHFIVSFKKDSTNILGVDIDVTRFKNMKAEIQVRTLAQHIVADTLHDRMYKTTVNPLKEHKREAAVIAAILENADAVVNNFVTVYDIFSLNQTSYMTVKKIKDELSILKVMNYCEKFIFTRFKNTLKMVAFLRNLGEYKDIESILDSFINEYKNGTLKLDELHETWLCFEYGLALLALSPNNPSARKYIKKALDNYSFLEDDSSAKWLEARRFYVFMLVTAATLAPSEKKWLERALKVDNTNPYACAEILRHENLNYSLLCGAVTAAEKHLNAGINEPEVYFVLGRLFLAQNDQDRAFAYYIDGLIFYLARAIIEGFNIEGYLRANKRIKQILERELQYIDGGTGICPALAELMHHIYEDAEPVVSKIIWVAYDNEILTNSAAGYQIKKFTSADLSERIKELRKEPGFLFLETADETLVKSALVLGLKVISTVNEMNNHLVLDEKIRRLMRLYTLPGEAESLKALFSERKTTLNSGQLDSAAKNIHEKYAMEMHEKYAENMFNKVRSSGETPADLGERTANWEKLEHKYKISNIDQAEYAFTLFEQAGYIFKTDSAGAISWDDINEAKKLEIAKLEHGRWNTERVVHGWSYHPIRDNQKLLHNNIVAWDELTPEIQRFDFFAMEGLIEYFGELGLYLHEK